MVQKQKVTVNNNKLTNEATKQQQIIHQQIEQYSGIIPHPSIIEGYEKNCKGATDRILAMAEKELEHKRKLEHLEQENIMKCREKMLNSEIDNLKRGQIFGFIILIIALIGSFYLVLKDHEIGGYTTAIGTILFYFGSIIYKNKIQERNKKEKE